MALSKEQFLELRKKGFTPQQIADFEKRQAPVTTEKADEVKLWDTRGFKAGFTGIGKGLGKLALGVGTLGRTIQEGVGRAVGVDLPETSIFDIGSEQRKKAEEAIAYNKPGEKIAGTITEIGATMFPAGAATKSLKGLSFARQMFGQGVTGGTIGTIQGGGDIDRDTALGAGLAVTFPVAGKAFAYGGNVLKGLAGFSTGTGSEVIEQVVKSPRAALVASKADDVTNLKETATAIREGVKIIKSNAGDDFAKMTSSHTEQLSKQGFKELTDDFFKEVDQFDFIDEKELAKIKAVVAQNDDYSAQGINKLASTISKFYKGTPSAQDRDFVISRLNRSIRDWVGKQVPEIAEANAKYADKMDLIEQMDALFKVRGSIDDRLGMQRTAEAVSRLFNANRTIARQGVEELESELGINVLGREAGRQLMSGVQTKFQAGSGDTVREVGRALIPPKLVLRLAAGTGLAKEAIENKMSILDPAARATAIELLTDLFGEGEGQAQKQQP